MDLRPGGSYHYCMKPEGGPAMWGKWNFREIAAPERLVYVGGFSDETGGITRHPMSADWPLQITSTITFKEQDGKTLLTIQWAPFNATEKESQTFDGDREAMTKGWGGALDKLTEQLAGEQG